MPVLSRFYGIVIRMYFLQKEHNPPHIHAIYGDDMGQSQLLTERSWRVRCLTRHLNW